ncbi:hypothetical protein T440DRAFT_149032 [Plenodomus tracheiphilus IPT5]|uniref:Sister chromatid cohesion protein Ctf8 n=1 Tax=Plenodomus tracheiphilus IPT5 TaxID=1408161 RepID=A0A6A7B368_9PLEO|nr:hypothetical protein T440DRAFT_149032 [Plenodomus tracheiphilus IPT5]
MPSIPLHIALSPTTTTTTTATSNPLPSLLHTPTGLALLEIQGTVHYPPPTTTSPLTTQIGKLVFPLYNPTTNDASDTKWMKRVYMYIGKGQRMTGECRKLGRPIGVVRKCSRVGGDVRMREGDDDDGGNDGDGGVGEREIKEELEIVEVVRYKIVFSARPEPISGIAEE